MNNEFEEQIEEICNEQKNAFNPGYAISSAKPPVFMKNLMKLPSTMIIIGIIFLVPVILNLIEELSYETVSNNLMMMIIGIGFILGGIIRGYNKRKNK